MEKVLVAANDESSLSAEDSAAGTAVMRHQSLLVAHAQRHVADFHARPEEIDHRLGQFIGAANFAAFNFVDRTAKHFPIGGKRIVLTDAVFSLLVARTHKIYVAIFLVVVLNQNAIVVIAHVDFHLVWRL